MLIVIMGVSGTGKSTIAKKLAEALEFTFVDADDFHELQSKIMMSQGTPLTNEMRTTWMQGLTAGLANYHEDTSVVLAFSGLKKAHRDMIRALPTTKIFLFLDGSFDLVYNRIQTRVDHFFPAQLLQNQYRVLEHPRNSHRDGLEQDIALISIEDCLDDCINNALIAIKKQELT